MAILIIFGDEVNFSLLINDYDDFIKLESTLKGIPYNETGTEVVAKIRSLSIFNNQTFYTDSMGLEMQKRILDYRSTWDLDSAEYTSSNYYPISSMMEIHDDQRALEVIIDRPRGGTSLEDGEIELMLQRRLYIIDNKGLGEAMNEVDYDSDDGRGVSVKAYTYFRIRGTSQPQQIQDTIQYMKMSLESPPYQLWSTNVSSLPVSSLLNLELELPSNVKMMLFPEGDNKLFMRVENIMEKFTLDVNATVNVTDIAQTIAYWYNPNLVNIEEVSLTGIFDMEEMSNKYKWKGEDFTSSVPDYSTDLNNITLEPQRIRSFRLTFEAQIES